MHQWHSGILLLQVLRGHGLLGIDPFYLTIRLDRLIRSLMLTLLDRLFSVSNVRFPGAGRLPQSPIRCTSLSIMDKHRRDIQRLRGVMQ